MPVSQGTRSVVAAFHTNRQHPLTHTSQITEDDVAGGFSFETGSLKTHNTDTIENNTKKWLWAKRRGVLGIGTMLRTSLATLCSSGRQLVKQAVDIRPTVVTNIPITEPRR